MTDPNHLDTRTFQRYLDKGLLTKEGYQAHLDALPDLSEQGEFVDYSAQFQAEEAQAAEESPAEEAPLTPGEAYPPATAAPPGSSALSATPPHIAAPTEG